MTVATTTSFLSLPSSFRWRAKMAMSTSPLAGNAVLVDGNQPVGIAVERQADASRGLPREVLRMGRAATPIDVHPVGLGGKHLDVGIKGGEQLWRRRYRGTVGTVESERHTAQGVGEPVRDALDITFDGVGHHRLHADRSP